MAKTTTEPTQKDITKILKKRERIMNSISKKQGELDKVNEEISKFADWMKNLGKSQS